MLRNCALLVCLVALIPPASGDGPCENWPNWRGPAGDGSSPCRGLPVEWSEEKNIVWKVELPSWSGATPIVWGERIFVMSPSTPAEDGDGDGKVVRGLPMGNRATPGGRELLLLCFDAASGRQLWRQQLDDRNALYGKQNMSSPSPVTDGRHVWALTGTGVLTCLTVEGQPRWRIDLTQRFGGFALMWGYASSPVLYEKNVIVQVLHGSQGAATSYLIALDAASGDIAWRQERKTDATRECPDAYTTPTLARAGSRVDLVVSGADYVTGHDPASGTERWRAGGLNPNRDANYRVVASPVVAGEMLIAPTRVRPLLALKLGGAGDVTATHLAWKLEKGGPDVPTPASDGQNVYVVNDMGLVTCVEIASGKVLWGPERTATGTVSASPLLADGKLYVTNESAGTTVLAAGPEFKLLGTNYLLDGYTISSIAAAHSRLYVRSSAHLYCIGKPAEK